jgi:hypothetical protein
MMKLDQTLPGKLTENENISLTPAVLYFCVLYIMAMFIVGLIVGLLLYFNIKVDFISGFISCLIESYIATGFLSSWFNRKHNRIFNRIESKKMILMTSIAGFLIQLAICGLYIKFIPTKSKFTDIDIWVLLTLILIFACICAAQDMAFRLFTKVHNKANANTTKITM